MSAVFDPLHLQAATLDVMAASHATPALLLQRQRQRLLRLLEAARSGSALYRERLPNPRARASDLLRVAPVSRAELMDRFTDWVTDPALRLDELRAFTSDPARIAEPWLGRYVVWESSGTSGLPGVFVQDAAAMAVYDAIEAVRHRVPARKSSLFSAFAGLDPFGLAERMALVTATGGHFASIVSFERLRQINPWFASGARSFDILLPTETLVQALNAFAPTVLATYPTAAALLAEQAELGHLDIRPRHIDTGGEHLTPAVRARVAKSFGATVRGSYGASEFLPLAWECSHGQLHVNEDWAILEPVDERHRPLPPGQPSHSVLLTNLANLVQPLIRYDLGDHLNLRARRCACGSPMATIELQGRRDDTLRVPGRRRGETISLLPLALCTVIEEEAGVFDFQLQQRAPRTLVLRVPLQGEAAEAAIARCRAALQAFATAQGALPIEVLGEPGCDVPRGRSGKACRMIWDA